MEIFFISGRSMEPFLIKKKDLVIVESSNINEVKFGDIITFYNKDKEFIEDKTNMVCHRVIAVKKRLGKIVLIEKGDNYLECSEVDEKSFVGRVKTVRKNNNNIDLFSTKWNILNTFIALLSKLSFYYNIKLMKRVNEKHKIGLQYKIEDFLLKRFL